MISIIVPIYNLQNYLANCLNSILLQSYGDFEVLMVDDGSNDDSAQICQKYEKEDQRFHFMRQENGGVSAARNTGLDCASGEYIAFIDGDDIVAPFYLEQLLKAIKGNAMAMCMHERVFDYKFVFSDTGGEFNYYSTEDSAQKLLLGRFPVWVCGGLLLSRFIGDLRFPTGIRNNEDKYFIYHYLLNAAGNMIAFSNQKMYGYYVRQGSATDAGWNGRRDTIIMADKMHELTMDKHPEWENLSRSNQLTVRLNSLRAIAKTSDVYRENKGDFQQIKAETLSMQVPACAPRTTKLEYAALQAGNISFILLIRAYNRIMTGKMRDKRNERLSVQH